MGLNCSADYAQVFISYFKYYCYEKKKKKKLFLKNRK